MFVIGITGSLSTGKSTVAKMFKDLGAQVIDADKIAHQLISAKGLAFGKIKKAYGSQVVKNRAIDRVKLAQIVFEKSSRLKKLINIIHPLVRKEVNKKLGKIRRSSRNAIVVLDVPLLFEAKMENMTDATIVVKAFKHQQIHRSTKKLKISKTQANDRIQSQWSLNTKIRKADFIINNSETKIQTKKQVKQLWQKIQQKIKK